MKDLTLLNIIQAHIFQKTPMFLEPFFYIIAHAQTIHIGRPCKIGMVFIAFFHKLLKKSTRCFFLGFTIAYLLCMLKCNRGLQCDADGMQFVKTIFAFDVHVKYNNTICTRKCDTFAIISRIMALLFNIDWGSFFYFKHKCSTFKSTSCI